MKAILSLAVALGSLSLTACNPGAGDPYYASWYDAFGNPCGYSYANPHPGCNYYANGMKILAWQDPYSFMWTPGQYWTSPTGIWYDPNGFAINSSQDNNDVSADVITQAAEQEGEIVRLAGKSLSQKYALSEDAGIRIAQSLNDWATLGRDRARTEMDVADFAQRLYGVSADQVKKAVTQATLARSLQPFEELNVDVAAHWGTSPEVSKTILKKWYQGELARFPQ